MENIIKKLDEKELNRFGFIKGDLNYTHERFPIKLVITDVEGHFLVDWADDRLYSYNTPPPVKNNSDLLNVMISVAPFMVRNMEHESVTNKENIVSESLLFSSEIFLGIEGVHLIPNIDFMGILKYLPGNIETATLMLGEESHFIVTMKNDNKFDLYMNETLMNYENVFEVSGAYPKVVEVEKDGDTKPFFGVGVVFPKLGNKEK